MSAETQAGSSLLLFAPSKSCLEGSSLRGADSRALPACKVCLYLAFPPPNPCSYGNGGLIEQGKGGMLNQQVLEEYRVRYKTTTATKPDPAISTSFLSLNMAY